MGNCLQGSNGDSTDLIESHDHDNEGYDQNPPSSGTARRRVGNGGEAHRRGVAPPSYYDVHHRVPPVQSNEPVYYPSPHQSRPASQLTEQEQIEIIQRIGLIQHLPLDVYIEGSKTDDECVICMHEFAPGDSIRFLPCLHTYHSRCIDDWLMRSFTCPSCMAPVDAQMLSCMQFNMAQALGARPPQYAEETSLTTTTTAAADEAGSPPSTSSSMQQLHHVNQDMDLLVDLEAQPTASNQQLDNYPASAGDSLATKSECDK